MKPLISVLAVLCCVAGTAEAQQRGGWCRGAGVAEGSLQICQYNTYKQCMDSRTGGESCYRNPN